jgi:hypothetical protein
MDQFIREVHPGLLQGKDRSPGIGLVPIENQATSFTVSKTLPLVLKVLIFCGI